MWNELIWEVLVVVGECYEPVVFVLFGFMDAT